MPNGSCQHVARDLSFRKPAKDIQGPSAGILFLIKASLSPALIPGRGWQTCYMPSNRPLWIISALPLRVEPHNAELTSYCRHSRLLTGSGALQSIRRVCAPMLLRRNRNTVRKSLSPHLDFVLRFKELRRENRGKSSRGAACFFSPHWPYSCLGFLLCVW